MRKLIYGMNLTLDGYVAAPGDDLGWSGPSDELFQWWLDEERAIGLLLYGRKLWEAMSSYWPTGDQQPKFGRRARSGLVSISRGAVAPAEPLVPVEGPSFRRAIRLGWRPEPESRWLSLVWIIRHTRCAPQRYTCR